MVNVALTGNIGLNNYSKNNQFQAINAIKPTMWESSNEKLIVQPLHLIKCNQHEHFNKLHSIF